MTRGQRRRLPDRGCPRGGAVGDGRGPGRASQGRPRASRGRPRARRRRALGPVESGVPGDWGHLPRPGGRPRRRCWGHRRPRPLGLIEAERTRAIRGDPAIATVPTTASATASATAPPAERAAERPADGSPDGGGGCEDHGVHGPFEEARVGLDRAAARARGGIPPRRVALLARVQPRPAACGCGAAAVVRVPVGGRPAKKGAQAEAGL
mmetsp:Transcript_6086/g.13999  ORF Transcript_6086/g.13999 Transcript_6086/m.13999 type:complete len:209 (+) Transcript_6086:260-886(+)